MSLAVSEMGCEDTLEPLWIPQPKQVDAIESEADVLFFGGSAGGSKTDTGIGVAFLNHQKSIIFRREFPQLKDVISRVKEIAGERGRFNGQSNTMLVDGKRTIEMGAVQYEGDVSKYKGRPHDLKFFDEVSDFTETQVRFLMAWNRSATPGQRCRVIMAGNPPTTAEGQWIIEYFGPWLDPDHSNPALPGELRWFAG